MRYDDPVYFQRRKPGEYNAETGNYGEDIITEAKRYASITDTSAETLNLVYGTVKQRSQTIRLQRPYTEPFDNIRVGDTICRVDSERRQKTFIVSEVQ